MSVVETMAAPEPCLLDLTPAQWVYPPGVVALTSLTKRRAELGLQTTIRVPRNVDTLTYLGRIDFFEHVSSAAAIDGDIEHLKAHSRNDSGSFTPLICVDPDGIEQLLHVLGKFLQRLAPQQFAKAYGAVDELLTNIHRHASLGLEEPTFACCQIQVYGTNRVELAFADLGVGYLASLKRNPEHTHLGSSEAALRGIVQRGLSRHHRPDETHGGGLRAVAQIARELGGDLRIITHDGEVWERWGRQGYSTLATPFPGTIAAAVLPIHGGA